MSGSTQRLGLFLVVLATLAFSTEAIMAKMAYRYGVTVESTLTIRYAIAAGAFWAVMLIIRQPVRLTARQLLITVAITLGGHVTTVLALFYSFQYLPAGMAILFLYVYPTLVSVLAYFVLNEPFTGRKALALALTFGGAAVILGQPLGGLDMRGVILALVAAVMNALFYVAGAKLLREMSVLVFDTYLVTIALVFFSILGAFTGRLSLDFPVEAWGWLVFLGLVGTALALAAIFGGIQIIGASRASIVSTLEPAATALLGYWFLGEKLTAVQMAGGALILLGVFLQGSSPAASGTTEDEN